MTLVEVLIVGIIIGLLTGLATLSFDVKSPRLALEREAERLRLILTAAADEAVLEGGEYGLQLEEGGYRILEFDAQASRWRQSEAPFFQLHRFPPPIEFLLEVEGAPFNPPASATSGTRAADRQNNGTAARPQILMFSSGELTPFDIYLSLEDDPLICHIASDGLQAIRLERKQHVG